MRVTNQDGYALHIEDDALLDLQALGEDALGHERCGALVGTVTSTDNLTIFHITHVIDVPNSAEDEERHFTIVGTDLKDAFVQRFSEGPIPPLMGFVHTHLLGGPDPSSSDIQGAHPTALNAVYHVPGARLTFYDPRDGYLTHFRWIKVRSK